MFCSEKENPDMFSAAQCGLGALGIIVTMTIQCEPAFKLREIQTSTTLDDVSLQGYDMRVNLISDFFALHKTPLSDL